MNKFFYYYYYYYYIIIITIIIIISIILLYLFKDNLAHSRRCGICSVLCQCEYTTSLFNLIILISFLIANWVVRFERTRCHIFHQLWEETMSHHNSSHNDKTKMSVQYHSFFSTLVTNPFNIFKLKKNSFVRSLKIQDIVIYPQCYASKGLLFKCQKCCGIKSYFNFYLLIHYLYNAVKGDMEEGCITNWGCTWDADGHQSINSSDYVLKELFQHLINTRFLYFIMLNTLNLHYSITSQFY